MLRREQKVDVSIATVYRNLGIPTEEGSIRRIAVPGEPDRYDKTLASHEHVFDLCVRYIPILSESSIKIEKSVLQFITNQFSRRKI